MADLSLGKIYFDSNENYQKIINSGEQFLSVANPNFRSSHTVYHNLGKYPSVRVWYLNGNENICEAIAGDSFFLFSSVTSAFNTHMCYYYIYTDRIVIYFNRGITSGATESTTVFWRIYYDGA